MTQRAEQNGPRGLRVHIRVGGQLDAGWSSWFEGLDVTPLASGVTSLHGVVADQAAVHGLLARIRDLGLPLRGLEVTDAAAGPSSEQALPDGSGCCNEPRSGPRPT